MESLVTWFATTLGPYISEKAVVFLISMMPLLELRGDCLPVRFWKYPLCRQSRSVLSEIFYPFRLSCCLSRRSSSGWKSKMLPGTDRKTGKPGDGKKWKDPAIWILGLVLFVGILFREPAHGRVRWLRPCLASILKVLTGYSLRNCHGNGDHVHCILCTGGKYRELVHRFVNNCIIHAGYGFECAAQKT